MISRVAYYGGQGLKNSITKFQPKSAITTSAIALSEVTPATSDTKSNNPSKYPPEFPPATSKRDFINFPRLSIRDEAPPVRLYFIPESWFTFFYPKTGYTGPYMFIASVGTYLFSKEIIVYDHHFADVLGFIALLAFINYKFGSKIYSVFTYLTDKEKNYLDMFQEHEKQYIKENINHMEKRKSMKDAVIEVTKARTEIIELQMEIAYRKKLVEIFQAVKTKLDCKIELENLERRVAHKNLVENVIKNVMKSITPEVEKTAMQACIADLNNLSANA